MKKQHFNGLLKSVGEAAAHARGERVSGLRVHARTADRDEIAGRLSLGRAKRTPRSRVARRKEAV